MAYLGHNFGDSWKKIALFILVELIVFQPVMVAQVALADTTPPPAAQYHDDQDCWNTVDHIYNPDSKAPAPAPTTAINGDHDPDAMPESPIAQSFNITAIKNDTSVPQVKRDAITSREYIDSVVTYYHTGVTYYKAPAKAKFIQPNTEWVFVCDTVPVPVSPLIFSTTTTFSPNIQDLLETLYDPSPKLAFKNLADKYAVFGEPCAGGFQIPFDQWTPGGPNPCPAPYFHKEDDFFPNGVWDAPKVDPRVIETLAYLITPAAEGGAGREFIRVSKIVQTNKDNPFNNPVNVDTSTDTGTAAATQPADSATPTPDDTNPSSFYIDPNDSPFAPEHVSGSVQIDQIDKVRVATKIVEHRLFGNNTTQYKFQPAFPVNVSWQTDQGLADNPPPDFSQLSMIESSRVLTNAAIVQLLNQYGLGDLQIDPSTSEINDFGDVALLVGESLLEQLLGSPKGSMKGWDLLSVLRSIGLAYVEQDMGLVPGALADTNPLDKKDTTADFNDVTASIGRSTVEYLLSFPAGSLRTKTGKSADILENLGRRYLESQVFKVSEDTMVPSDGFPLATTGDLLARLGEGRIEQVFKLPKQSLRTNDYDAFRTSSYKASLLFPERKSEAAATQDDYDMADYVSGQLNLAFNPYTYVPTDDQGHANGSPTTATTNMYGFTEGDFHFPSLVMAQSDLNKFKQLVGSRVIETSLGMFRAEGVAQRLPTEKTGTPQEFIKYKDVTLLARNRPINDGTNGINNRIGNWCGSSELEYTFKDAYMELKPDNFDDMIKHLESDNNPSWGSGIYDHKCDDYTDKVAQLSDLDLLTNVQSTLFSTTPENRLMFLNQEKAPQITDFEGTNHLNRRFNTALLLFYNKAENYRTISLNTIVPTATGNQSVSDGSNTTAIDQGPTITLNQLLNELQNGSGNSGSGYKFAADSGLRDRIAMIQRKYDSEKGSNFFDLNPLRTLPANQLDNALIDRINALSAKPKRTAFQQEYGNDDLNGWLFLLQDLRGRLNCKVTGGSWQLNSDDTAYTCNGNLAQGGSTSNLPDAVTKDKLQQAISKIDQLISSVNSLGDTLIASLGMGAITDGSGMDGQSAWSLGIGMDGQQFNIDDNFRFIKDAPQYNKDLMRLLLSPQRNSNGTVPLNASIGDFFARGSDGNSNIGEVGKNFAARKFTTDPLAQRTFIAKLKTDFSQVKELANEDKSNFDKAMDASKDYAIDESQFSDKGLANGDFQSIFMLNSSKAVFERVGKDELLRTVWQRTGAAKKITSSDQFQGILKEAQSLSQSLEFYTSRIDQIRSKSDQLQDKLDKLDGDADFKLARDNLRAVNAKYKGKRTTTITYLQDIGRAYQPVLDTLKEKGTQRDLKDVLQDVEQILHLVEEIVAGHALPQQQYGALDPNNGLLSGGGGTNQGCSTKANLIAAFTGKGSIATKVLQMGEKAGGCAVDTAFGLPGGSMYNWYTLGQHAFPPAQENYITIIDENGNEVQWLSSIDKISERNKHLFEQTEAPDGSTQYKAKVPVWGDNSWTMGNLQIAVAIADQQSRGSPFDLNKLQDQSVDQINALVKQGQHIIEMTILAKLLQMIPGIGQFSRQYSLTTRDFVSIMHGDMRPLIAKVGGSVLDNALSLPKGTSASIIFPQCTDNSGAPAKCNKTPGEARTDPDNVRMEILAGVGLTKLGLTVPNFPVYFSFTSGGDLLDNWGNAMISQALNLAPNSFKGSTLFLDTSDPDFSKKCAASPLMCQNNIPTLMSAFGLSVTPPIQNLEKIRAKMVEFANKDTLLSTQELSDYLNRLHNTFNKIENDLTFGPLRDPLLQNLGYWADRNNPDQLIVGERTSYIEGLGALWSFVANQKNASGSALFDHNAVGLLRQYILNNQGDLSTKKVDTNQDTVVFGDTFPLDLLKSENDTVAAFHDRYSSYIGYFQDKLEHLNKQYNLRHDDHNPGNDQSFNGLLRGSYDTSRINHATGMANTVNDILGKKFDQWINDQGPSWLKDLNQAFKYITADPNICGKETGFGDFFAKIITGGFNSNFSPGGNGSYCGMEGLSGTGTAEILTSTSPNYVRLRELLFDKFLSHTFSGDLEREIGFKQGTFRSLMVDPKHGDQILISQGVMMLTDRIFGSAQHDDPCQYKITPDETCVASTVKNAARSAFMAGFYDTINKKFTLDFQSKRAIDAFVVQMNKALDNQLARIGKYYIGVEITRADFDQLIKGDMRVFGMLALQFTANRLNKSMLASRSGRNPAAQKFIIKYADVRDAVGLPSQLQVDGELAAARHDALVANCQANTGVFGAANCYFYDEQTLTKMYEDTVRQELLDMLDKDHNVKDTEGGDYVPAFDADKNGDGVIDDQEKQDFITDPNGLEADVKNYSKSELNAAAQNGLPQRLHDRKIQAQDSMKYAMLDIAAFTLDSNIPTHFSERLLGKDADARLTALGQYAFNALLSSDSSLGKTLQSVCGGQANRDECFNFFKDLGSALAAGSGMAQKLQDIYRNKDNQIFLNALDLQFNSWFKKNLDITLPPQTFKGIYAWAMDGFKPADFNKDTLCFGGTGADCKDGFTATPVGKILEDWGEAAFAKWADKQFGFKVGTAAKIIQSAQIVFTLQRLTQFGKILNSAQALKQAQAFDAYFHTKAFTDMLKQKQLANAKALAALKQQLVILAGQIIAGMFSKALSNDDQVLGLPPGTLETVVAAGASAIIASITRVPLGGAFWVGVAIALGVNLVFGVTRVDITTYATGDGYYPFYMYGTGEAKGWRSKVYPEHVSTDAKLGLFIPTRGITYRTGLKAVAQEKVTGLLHDLLMMPTSDWAAANQLDPNDLWIPQLFTYGSDDFNPLLDPRITTLYTNPAPASIGEQTGDQKAGIASTEETSAYGYGDWSNLCEKTTYNAEGDALVCTRPDDRLSGYFPTPSLVNAIHIRF